MMSPRVVPMPVLLLLAACASACAADSAEPSPSAAAPHALPGCTLPSDVSASPRSVADMVAIASALPPQASVACFLQTLARPLQVSASMSFQSLQPAVGERSPRIFLAFDTLLLSVVPAGSGQKRIEASVMHENYRSVKAEIVMPSSSPLDADAPYANIRAATGAGTVCSSCHGHEAAFEQIPGAFVSGALRPADDELVSLGQLQRETRSCDRAREPERCDMLHAIFDAPVVEYRFPPAMPVFGQ